MRQMRLFGIIAAVLMLTAASPALAWLETQPGDAEWPEIPGQAGMAAFLATWTPQCNDGGYQNAGDMTIHGDGRITFAHSKEWKWGYRIVDVTPHYVVTLIWQSGNPHFWAFRPLGKSFHPRSSTGMSVIAVNECPVYGDPTRKKSLWTSSDEELVAFWKSNQFCHPDLTEKTKGGSYWGGDWGQGCYFAR